MSDYTPTTDQVRARYIAACSYNSTVPPGVNLGAEFDRWITENNQKVRAHTLNEAADILHEEVLYQAILGNNVSRWLMVESIITSSLRGDNDETL